MSEINTVITIIPDSLGEPSCWNGKGRDVSTFRETNNKMIIIGDDVIVFLGRPKNSIKIMRPNKREATKINTRIRYQMNILKKNSFIYISNSQLEIKTRFPASH